MIKTLAASVRDYKKVTIATPLLVLGEVICEMSIPFVTANLIDSIKEAPPSQTSATPASLRYRAVLARLWCRSRYYL